MSHQLQGYTL